MDAKSPVISGLSTVLAYTLLDRLVDDLSDTFGKSFLYHPFSVWACIVMLVHSQTNSFKAGFVIVLLYETAKNMWRSLQPEPPALGRLRKLLHRLQNNERLSNSDVSFLNSITPADVDVSRKGHHFGAVSAGFKPLGCRVPKLYHTQRRQRQSLISESIKGKYKPGLQFTSRWTAQGNALSSTLSRYWVPTWMGNCPWQRRVS
jgi:hypothetical protein